MARKLLAELFGTAILVFVACGVATVAFGFGNWVTGVPVSSGLITTGYLATALTFGLVLLGLVFLIGPISGCHVNPAVSFGVWLTKRMSTREFVGYVIAQCVGGVAGAAALDGLFHASRSFNVRTTGLGADGYGAYSMIHLNAMGAFGAEVALTAIFVLVILSVTSKDAHASTAGIAIGLTLAFVHLFGIALDGTSVNPARSLGPALFVGGGHLSQLWLFLVAPMVGAAVAAAAHRGLRGADA